MLLVKVLTCLLPLVGVCGNHFELSQLIERVHKESDSATVYFIGMDDGFVSDFMRAHLDIPVAIFTTLPSGYIERFYNNEMLVVQDKCQKQVLEKLIPRLKVRKFVIISAGSLRSLQHFFSFFKENNFRRIFGIVDTVSYAYLPYADNLIQKLSQIDTLPDAMRDLNGFTIRSSVKDNVPKTFRYTDESGKLQLGGRCAQIFLNFLRRHNATFSDTFIYNYNGLVIPEIMNATVNNGIDISMNALYPIEKLDYSYHMDFPLWGFLVPTNSHVDPNEYFLRPFSPTTWIFIGLMLVYIMLMDVAKNICTNVTADVWGSFSRSYLAMLFLSSERRAITAYRFHALVLLFAFVIGNLYVIYFTSFLTVFIKVRQYETIQDLIDNNVPVMIPEPEWLEVTDPELHPAGFENIVVPVNYSTYYAKLHSLTATSFAYAISSGTAQFLIDFQAHYAKPLFHLSRDGINNFHQVFVLARHSPFKEILDNFISQVLDTGLLIKWDRDAIVQALKIGFRVDVDREVRAETAPVPLTLHHLRFGWNCLTIGLSLALVVFLGEVIYRNFKRILNFFRNKFQNLLRNLRTCK